MLAVALVARAQEAKVVEKEGRVVITKAGNKPVAAAVGVGLAARDKLGTGESSRAVLQMSEKWFARVDEETDIEIVPGMLGAKSKDALKMALGGAFIYSREAEGEVNVQTPSATGGLRGTQLMVRVWPDGKSRMQVIEGEVDLANEFGQVLLKAGEAGEAEPGQAPHKTAVIETRNLLQWALYYPAVLVPDELGLSGEEAHALTSSLEAYRQGDLLGALDQYPHDFTAASDAARLYHAAVLLATGRVGAARKAMQDVATDKPGRRALERMLAAVQFSELPVAGEPGTAGEALAESYYQQSRSQLEPARAAARRATELAPQSGFAWARLAELEFSFGRTKQAHVAIDKALGLTPRNAQAHALRGYLLSAENRVETAQASFQTAVELDGGLGNAWLGLGLTKIKLGHLAEGRADLQTAVTVEPTRSFFYSYHGKALSMAGADQLARKDLALARQTDPQDPTPLLYSAIQAQQESRYNEAIADMQESLSLNSNRRVYRSQFLLDQDKAVRSSNLAKIYQNNGMTDLAVREATRAVEGDYTNASAHLFLANSFDALRDPTDLQLRYETAWYNELLLADLLAPVGGGHLSQFVSEQEYSQMLEADGFGGTSVTEWRENGYLDQKFSVYGTAGRLSGGVDFVYHNNKGDRANDDDSRRELDTQFKYEVTPNDMFYTKTQWIKLKKGDLHDLFANASGETNKRSDEKQLPGQILVGWNHQWAPGVNTLFIGGRLADEQNTSAANTLQLLLQRDPSFLQPGFLRPKTGGGLEYTSDVLRNAAMPPAANNQFGTLVLSADFQRIIAPFLGGGRVTGAFSDHFSFSTHRQFEILSGELQHIWQTSRNTLLLGGRWQDGTFEAQDKLGLLNTSLLPLVTTPASAQQTNADFSRESLYAYDFLKVVPALTLIAGVSWDRIDHPDNWRYPPVNDRQARKERVNGKFGFTFAPSHWVTARGVYTESQGGESYDESVRLEPVQLAGFNQAFRTVISESSFIGSVSTPVYKNLGLSLEGELPGRTWWAASGNRLTEDVKRTVGAFDILFAPIFPYGLAILPSNTSEHITYREEVFTASINHLIGSEYAVGAGYRHTRSRLHYLNTQIPVALLASADQVDEPTLDEVTLNANWNSPEGWFARAETNWYDQSVQGSIGGVAAPGAPGDRFWHYNLRVGCRFNHNAREVSVGMLNLSGRDYQLDPLNYISDLPRARTFVIRCRLNF